MTNQRFDKESQKIKSKSTFKRNQTKMELQENNGKQIGMIAYLIVIGLIIAFVMNSEKKSKFAQYHIRQMLRLL
jgi:tetrahydromethanopterin S-methyltransferase subunit G